MRIDVHAPDAAPAVATLASAQAESVFGRYGRFIREATVRLTDQNGPRGGVDQECLVRVSLRGAPDITIRERGKRPLQAIGAAMKRVRRLLSERINARPRMPRRKTRKAIAEE